MAGGKSLYLSNKFLNMIFNGTAFTAPATIYCALYVTTAPTDTTSGTEVSTSSTGYARVAVTPNTTNFSTSTTQSITNNTAIIFPTATASWGTIIAASFMDALTGGNMLYWGPLGSNVTVNTGNTFEFLVGGFSASEA